MRAARFWPLLGLLVVLQTTWLVWWLLAPLPNAGSVGGRGLSRGLIWLQALPWISVGRPLLAQALGELGHLENLPQRLPIVLAAALIAGAASELGHLSLRGLGLREGLRLTERAALAFVLGTAILGAITLGLGRAGWLDPWWVRLGLGVPIVAELACRFRSGRTIERPHFAPGAWLAFALVAGPFLLVMALGSMLPTFDFDALEYHLQGPKEYFQNGRVAFLPHNVYTSMPFGVEMLHLLGMVVLGDWWRGALVGQLLVMLHAPAAAALIAGTARRVGSPRAAWFAAVIYLTTPWIYRLATIPYVEGPLCDLHAALIFVIVRAWSATSDARPWGLVGALAGGAMACKYPALISAVVPFGALAIASAIRRRSWPIAAAFGVGVALIIGPWLLKNLAETGNPVYPLGWRVFGGRDWSEAREAQWSRIHGPKAITLGALADGLLDVIGRSDWQSPLYLALAPLALLRPGSRRAARVLWGYAAYIFATWWLLTHRLDRFWLPILPPLAILAGLGADWSRHWAWSVLLGLVLTVAIATNAVFVTTALAGFNQWTGDLSDLRREVPAKYDPALAQLDRELPGDARVLLVGQAAVFHINHRIIYNTVFDDEIIETLARDRTPAEVGRGFRRLGVTHVYVDWFQIGRYRSPGNYGFSAFVTPAVFRRLVDAGVLDPLPSPGPERSLYRVRSSE